jgi:hypothetical protein
MALPTEQLTASPSFRQKFQTAQSETETTIGPETNEQNRYADPVIKNKRMDFHGDHHGLGRD